jgi:Mg-chelatase subunit ChlD
MKKVFKKITNLSSFKPSKNAFMIRNFGDLIGPGKSNHLSSANNANKLIKPQLKHLAPKIHVPNQDIKLSVSHSAIEVEPNKYLINLALNATTKEVKPAVFICCLDISGSMDGSATFDNKDPEASKFSRLDLVKHSVNTIIHCLRPIDQLAVITFTDHAAKVMPLMPMDATGKRNALKQVDSINSQGSTNLWDGLKMTLDELKNLTKDNNTNVFSVVLTDGEPNQNPPRGIMHEFLKRLSAQGLTSTIHTFGYGYGLDSKLLTELSEHGGGLFAHIPDHTMCNSVFINWLSNSFATAINRVDLGIGQMRSCNQFSNFSHPTHNQNNVIIGGIQSGVQHNVLFGGIVQNPRDFKIDLNIGYNGINLPYSINGLTSQNQTKGLVLFDNNYRMNSNLNQSQLNGILSGDFAYQIPKMWLMNTITQGMKNYNLPQTCSDLDNLHTMILNMTAQTTDKVTKENLNDLLKNIKSGESIEGQIYKAFSNDEWYKRWGNIYLKYFMRSHQLQIASNFKDTSLQHYGGPLFKEIQTEVEDIFSTIPVPQPSRSSQPFTGNFKQSFYQPSGPCVDGNGLVLMADGTEKLVKHLKKGDRVFVSSGMLEIELKDDKPFRMEIKEETHATIECVIKTKIPKGQLPMLTLNGMHVTPWHPIRINGKWDFPINVGKIDFVNCDYIYNFVLDNHHIMKINNIDVITLGHEIDTDPILEHPFFGTQKVIEDLKTQPGWQKGLIEINDYKPRFNNKNMIESFFPKQEKC